MFIYETPTSKEQIWLLVSVSLTTPEDIQTITAAEYPEAGVISGCEVTGTSTMKYKVAGGAVVIHLSPGRAVRVPVLA